MTDHKKTIDMPVLTSTSNKYKYFMYAKEMLSVITSNNLKSFKWLYAVKEYDQFEINTDSIIELLNIFENIIDINALNDTNPQNVNRLASQLVNIIKLSKSFDVKAISNIKYHLSILKNEALNPAYIPSYGFSQEGEDLILKRLFPPDKIGFFIDVGAYDPIRFSNTYLFYKKGWRGINIDPRPGVMKLFNTIRPNDINVEAAIGDGYNDEQIANYISYEEPAYNKVFIGKNVGIDNNVNSNLIDIIEVQLRSLDDILEEHSDAFSEIDFITIDVEGFEMQVLNGFSIDKYKPNFIVLELRGFDISTCADYDEYNFIINNGYKLRSVLYHSLIFEYTK